MLALRDQENLVHAHQTAAAAKPLNQNVKTLQPKTPGARPPKTPFKVPLNDENDPLTFGKKTVKALGNKQENVKPNRDTFLTPLETRSRAPLGMKTTNAKARGLQTPAAGTVKLEKTNKRCSTQKIKKFAPLVDQNQVQVREQPAHDGVPDIEYMPPKPKELPDIPDDITYDTTFPQFQPKNLALGLESVYGDNEVGSDGLTKRERKFQEDSIAFDKKMDEIILKQVEDMGFEDKNEFGPLSARVEEPLKPRVETSRSKVTASKTKYTSNISTIRARDAATALSGTASSVRTSRPGVVPRPRVASSMFASKKPKAPTNPSPMRHTAASASSRTTMGYSMGRTMSSRLSGRIPPTTKQSTPRATVSPETYMEVYGPPPLGSEMWHRCKAAGCFDEEEDRLAANAERMLPTYGEDEEAQNFQLTL